MALARKSPPTLPGAQVAKHEARRIAWTPEAKQISDRICVAGSRSTSIVPVTSGNRTDRDPIEERGLPLLSERLGQPFIIENRPGATGNIGTEAVTRAPESFMQWRHDTTLPSRGL